VRTSTRLPCSERLSRARRPDFDLVAVAAATNRRDSLQSARRGYSGALSTGKAWVLCRKSKRGRGKYNGIVFTIPPESSILQCNPVYPNACKLRPSPKERRTHSPNGLSPFTPKDMFCPGTVVMEQGTATACELHKMPGLRRGTNWSSEPESQGTEANSQSPAMGERPAFEPGLFGPARMPRACNAPEHTAAAGRAETIRSKGRQRRHPRMPSRRALDCSRPPGDRGRFSREDDPIGIKRRRAAFWRRM